MYLPLLIFGFLSASSALVLELILLPSHALGSPSFTASFLILLLAVATIEEVAKFFFLRQYLLRYFQTLAPGATQIFLLGTLFGIGFSALELSLAFFDGLQRIGAPIIGTALLHIAMSILILASLRKSPSSLAFRLLSLALVIFLHFLYNASVSFWN